ncbi:Protein of unknown function [Asanoa hainanensis]|uniref:DUF3152 domain-containing protein n=1 Tax=Asanoa hainanensis TaxID=560556 RepID=A0A239HSS9_9ACTN|nr:DUF3152 domain-containing protein [Asanoa hainanensis]SNS84271.1 Protein of unknown function [Asanoa hainanensis]
MATPLSGHRLPAPRTPEPPPRPDRYRGLLALGLALIASAALLMAVNHARRSPDAAPQPSQTQAASPVPGKIGPFAAPTASNNAGPAPDGPGVFSTERSTGRTLGRGTDLRRFHVAVEKSINLDLAPFVASVDTILGDKRSWIADGKLRLRRVGADQPADFTIYLASAGTSERMCAEGGLDTERFTSCQLGDQVVINADRWVSAVPWFEAPLGEYQAYAVNHEVGHQLGHQHEACPKPGAAAPVMQQQTYGMQGCLPNGWPYVGGRRYAGPPIP